MRDLVADWKRWSPTERLIAALLMGAVIAGMPTLYFMGAV